MIKKYLKSYRRYEDLVKYLNSRIALRAKLGAESPDDLEARDHFARLVSDIDCALGKLSDPDEQRLLRLRYVDGWSWTKVGFALHYSKSQTMRIHARALDHLEDITLREGLLWEEVGTP